jgi:hypothetical protein
MAGTTSPVTSSSAGWHRAGRRATASVGSDLFATLLPTGYNIDMDNFRITRLAGLRYVLGLTGGTTESGADSVDLVVAGYERDSLSSQFGGKLAFLLTRRWRAEAYGQWEHEHAGRDSIAAMAFTLVAMSLRSAEFIPWNDTAPSGGKRWKHTGTTARAMRVFGAELHSKRYLTRRSGTA